MYITLVWSVRSFFDGSLALIPIFSSNETEIILELICVEEPSTKLWSIRISVCSRLANPNGMLDVIKNNIVTRDKTDFN